MAFLLIALLISLSTVNCEYRKPFTAFHPAQRDHLQKQKHQGFIQSNHPLIQGLEVGSRLQRVQNSFADEPPLSGFSTTGSQSAEGKVNSPAAVEEEEMIIRQV